jgi:site-specific DNA recombinase
MKAYGYCRYSSDLQTEASIEQQKNELIEYANKNNITIIDFYCDEAKSGTKDNRENFQAMISDCRKNLVDCILVWKTDRFARNTQDSLYYKMKLEKLGIKLISITQPIDNSTPEGQLMYTLLAGMDEYYSKNLASNVKRALKSNANNCQFNGGIAPLGYDIVDKKYIINEQESIIVQKIFDMYISGIGVIEIALKLNQEGFKTKKNKPFGKNSVYDIISNERYTGTYIFNKGTKHDHRNKNDDEIRIEDGIPAIISKEMYQTAMNMRTTNKRKNFKQNSNTYILSGLVFCGECGGKYNGSTSIKQKNGVEYRTGYYACSNRNRIGNCKNHRIKQELIEDYVVKTLIEKILNGNSIKDLIEGIKIEYAKLKSDSKDEITGLKRQLTEVEKKIKNLIDIIATTGNAKLVSQLDLLTAQEEDIKDKLEFCEENNSINVSNEQIERLFTKDISSLKKGSKEEIKKIVTKYIKRITIYKDTFSIEYTFDDIKKICDNSQIGLVATVRNILHQRISLILK